MLVQLRFEKTLLGCGYVNFVSQLLRGESLLSIWCDLPCMRFALTRFLNQTIFPHRGKMVRDTLV